MIFVLVAFCLPGRWFPWTIYLPAWLAPGSRPSNSKKLRVIPSSMGQGSEDDGVKAGGSFPPDLPSEAHTETTTFLLVSAPAERRTLLIHKWIFAISFLLLIPFAAWIALAVGPTSLSDFLEAIERSDAVGDCYWSLFGRDNSCCQWVEHVRAYLKHLTALDDFVYRTTDILCIIGRTVPSEKASYLCNMPTR